MSHIPPKTDKSRKGDKPMAGITNDPLADYLLIAGEHGDKVARRWVTDKFNLWDKLDASDKADLLGVTVPATRWDGIVA
jgi:hypothetical protein